MPQKEFIYGKYRYEYSLLYEDRKTTAITVFPNGKIVLKCPKGTEQFKIDAFLKKKWLWLEKQLRYFQKYKKKRAKREYVSGESFLYLGRQYRLNINRGKEDSVYLLKGILQLTTTKKISNKDHNKFILENWYTQKREKAFNKRYQIVLKKFDYNFKPELVVRKMNKRWGSYLSGKKIILNPELIKASSDCIDYVISHELCHMRYKKHNQEFFVYLEKKCPGWKTRKEKLEIRLI